MRAEKAPGIPAGGWAWQEERVGCGPESPTRRKAADKPIPGSPSPEHPTSLHPTHKIKLAWLQAPRFPGR